MADVVVAQQRAIGLVDASGDAYLLQVHDLKTYFFLDQGVVKAVDGASLGVKRGQTLGIVGESGCGKSITARSILQIVEPPGRIVGGDVLFRRPMGGRPGAAEQVVNLARLAPNGRQIRSIRGKEIAMIFQEPMSSLSAHYTIGNQIAEVILLHQRVGKREARAQTIELLRQVGISRPAQRVDDYPHQLSGGMRQRAMIAMAISCNPSLLIADEPTTALDVTTQAQILDLLRSMQAQHGMAIIMITHDLGVVAEMADDVAVMYLGTIAETGSVGEIFHDAKHPYTQALLRSIPKLGLATRQRLDTITGMVPDPFARPDGCPFHPRCTEFMPGKCDRQVPPPFSLGPGREVRCLLYGPQPATAERVRQHRGADAGAADAGAADG
jgi:oligopeptide/dipeptide ABC transporter ATP-binding protein